MVACYKCHSFDRLRMTIQAQDNPCLRRGRLKLRMTKIGGDIRD